MRRLYATDASNTAVQAMRDASDRAIVHCSSALIDDHLTISSMERLHPMHTFAPFSVQISLQGESG